MPVTFVYISSIIGSTRPSPTKLQHKRTMLTDEQIMLPSQNNDQVLQVAQHFDLKTKMQTIMITRNRAGTTIIAILQTIVIVLSIELISTLLLVS